MAQFPSQIRDRGEDAPCNDIPFNLGEPDLDLIQPRGKSRCEVQTDVGVDGKEISHGLGFVSGEVVQDDEDLLLATACGGDLRQRLHELLAGVARRRLA